jgi:hypothetical protein
MERFSWEISAENIKKPAILVLDKLIRGLQVLDQICFLEVRNDVERSNPNED